MLGHLPSRFPGVHSDVGGGFPETKSGLSDIALQWMLEKAQSCSLNFDAISKNPNPSAKMHESYQGFYTLQKKLFRPIGFVYPKQGNTNESLHPAVIERYKNDTTYRPQNLKDYFTRYPLKQ